MSAISHQTVRLSRGRHSDPEHGVCVMELASMLAGEPFTDRPRSVCPVIAAFLRRYNDGVDEERRSDLYRFASLSVGTRAPQAVQARRAAMCRHWARAWYGELRRSRWRWLPAPWPSPELEVSDPGAGALAGIVAAKLARRRRLGAHAAALELVEWLIGCGRAVENPRVVAAHDRAEDLPLASSASEPG